MPQENVYAVLSNVSGYLLLTSPCLRPLHFHTLILLHWTAPSPPPAKGGSQEARGEALGRVAQEAGAQTAGKNITWLSLQRPYF